MFVLLWGTKVVRRRLGYVADFCPLCGDVRCFKMTRVGMARHLYYISFGKGSLVEHQRTCAFCDVDLKAQPDLYREIHRKKLPTSELVAITNPRWRERHSARLDLEEKLAKTPDKLSPQQRQELVEEPFILLSPKVEQRFREREFDDPTILAIIGLFIIGAVTLIIAKVSVNAILLGWAAGICLIVWRVFQAKRRFFRQKIFPALVPALRRLRVTPAEIEDVLKKMSARGLKIGSKLNANKVVEVLSPAGQRAPSVI